MENSPKASSSKHHSRVGSDLRRERSKSSSKSKEPEAKRRLISTTSVSSSAAISCPREARRDKKRRYSQESPSSCSTKPKRSDKVDSCTKKRRRQIVDLVVHVTEETLRDTLLHDLNIEYTSSLTSPRMTKRASLDVKQHCSKSCSYFHFAKSEDRPSDNHHQGAEATVQATLRNFVDCRMRQQLINCDNTSDDSMLRQVCESICDSVSCAFVQVAYILRLVRERGESRNRKRRVRRSILKLLSYMHLFLADVAYPNDYFCKSIDRHGGLHPASEHQVKKVLSAAIRLKLYPAVQYVLSLLFKQSSSSKGKGEAKELRSLLHKLGQLRWNKAQKEGKITPPQNQIERNIHTPLDADAPLRLGYQSVPVFLLPCSTIFYYLQQLAKQESWAIEKVGLMTSAKDGEERIGTKWGVEEERGGMLSQHEIEEEITAARQANLIQPWLDRLVPLLELDRDLGERSGDGALSQGAKENVAQYQQDIQISQELRSFQLQYQTIPQSISICTTNPMLELHGWYKLHFPELGAGFFIHSQFKTFSRTAVQPIQSMVSCRSASNGTFWTSTFTCPISSRIFRSEKYSSSRSTTYVDDPLTGSVWYDTKLGAEESAATRALQNCFDAERISPVPTASSLFPPVPKLVGHVEPPLSYQTCEELLALAGVGTLSNVEGSLRRGSTLNDIVAYLYGKSSREISRNTADESIRTPPDSACSFCDDETEEDSTPSTLKVDSTLLVPEHTELSKDERRRLRIEACMYMADMFDLIPLVGHLQQPQRNAKSAKPPSYQAALKNYQLGRVHLTSYYLLHLVMEHSTLVHRKFVIVVVCSCILLASKLEDTSIRVRRLLGNVQQLKWIVSGNEWVLEDLRAQCLHVAEQKEYSLTPEIDRASKRSKVISPLQRLIQRFEVHLFSLLWSCQGVGDEERSVIDRPPPQYEGYLNDPLPDYCSGLLPLHPIASPSIGADNRQGQLDSPEVQSQYHEPCYTHGPLCLLQDMRLLSTAAWVYANHLKSSKSLCLSHSDVNKPESSATCFPPVVDAVVVQVARYMNKVSGCISRCRSDLARRRLKALRESQPQLGGTNIDATISFSVSDSDATLYPDLNDLLDSANASAEHPPLVSPSADTELSVSADDEELSAEDEQETVKTQSQPKFH